VGKSGRGFVIQDINASQTICMSKIKDVSNYPQIVPNVKSVEIYESYTHRNVGLSSLLHLSNSCLIHLFRERLKLVRNLILVL
jgi:ribosome-associated toxin RatA of RatAB toxin-antitoxin module